MQVIHILIFFFIIPLCTLSAKMDIETPSFINPSNAISKEPRLMINNRPLAKINGKIISLYDVVQRMDLFLYDYSPEYNPTTPEKYQFYVARWRPTLEDMIADELVLLDAEQKEIKISDGEVRENLEDRFGPNIMSNLDKVNLEYEEARDLIRNELIVQQLIGMKVQAKVLQIVTPQVVKKAYDEYLGENPPTEEWTYQVLSIRGKDKDLCEKIGEKAYVLLKDQGSSIEEVAQELEEEGVSISLSDDYQKTSSKISKPHLEVIQNLSSDTFSPPVNQVSRFDQSNVTRIFHLKDIIQNLPNPFEEMYDKLKNELFFETFSKEKESYIEGLKIRFGYDKLSPEFELPEDYRPFVII